MLNIGASSAVAYLTAVLDNNILQEIRTSFHALMKYNFCFVGRSSFLQADCVVLSGVIITCCSRRWGGREFGTVAFLRPIEVFI
jgi:hypothetical protein